MLAERRSLKATGTKATGTKAGQSVKKFLANLPQTRKMAGPIEVLFEFHRVGDYMKVTAVDPITYTEVSIVGSPNAGQALLQRIAARKLLYVLRRDAQSKAGPNRSGLMI